MTYLLDTHALSEQMCIILFERSMKLCFKVVCENR